MFADRPIKASKSAPADLAAFDHSPAPSPGLSSLSFVVSHPNLLAPSGFGFNGK